MRLRLRIGGGKHHEISGVPTHGACRASVEFLKRISGAFANDERADLRIDVKQSALADENVVDDAHVQTLQIFFDRGRRRLREECHVLRPEHGKRRGSRHERNGPPRDERHRRSIDGEVGTFSVTWGPKTLRAGTEDTECIQVRLDNEGGLITLLDPRGRKVHGVAYTRRQAADRGRPIVF